MADKTPTNLDAYGPAVFVFRAGGGMIEQIELAHTPDYYLLVPPSAGDPKRFGTVNAYDNGWALVKPTDLKADEQALQVGAVKLS